MLDLSASQYDWEVLRALCALHALDPGQVLFQYFAIQEENGVQRLVLGRSGDIAADGEVSEERAEMLRAELAGMTFAMKEDVAANPVQIGLLGANAVVLDTDDVAHLIEQAAATRRKASMPAPIELIEVDAPTTAAIG
jgi:hypothetical protein